MKSISIISVLCLVFLSCNEARQNQTRFQNQATTKIDSFFLRPHFQLPSDTPKTYICGTAMANKLFHEMESNRDISFTSFWASFQNDLKYKNYNGLSVKTKFPLKAIDEPNDSSINEYSEEDFKMVFSKFLKQNNTAKIESKQESLKFYVLDPNTPYVAKGDSSIRVRDMFFEKIGADWKLTSIYNRH
jgi:hypothetical protein